MNQLESTHLDFLRNQANSLVDFARGSVLPSGGFGYLDAEGHVDSSKPLECYLQCRKIQVFGLAHLMGLSDGKSLVQHGVDALNELFRDDVYGGFFNSVLVDGTPVADRKLAYDHMFVLLAATTAQKVGVDGADELLGYINRIIDRFFWEPQHHLMSNDWDLNFTHLDSYRGINANMHAVEALTAAFEATGEAMYRDRAYAISKRAVDEFARKNQWMLPEHFDSDWHELKEFNADHPADPFKPYGVTIGHLFEWSRLIIQVGLLFDEPSPEREWIGQAAQELYALAKSAGWAADGAEGFIYTMDWQQRPVVKSRMHWVAAEAVMAAYTLWVTTQSDEYLNDYHTWWSYIQNFVIDHQSGSWHHELNSEQQVVSDTWSGKPDVYHAFNACILPLLPMKGSFIGSVGNVN